MQGAGKKNSNNNDASGGGGGGGGDWLNWFTGIKIPKTHATVGLSNLIATHKDYRTLFVNRRLPDMGWSDVEIQHLLFTLSTLDTNHKHTTTTGGSCNTNTGNDDDDDYDTVQEDAFPPRWCGVGEREGRVYSSLVSQRHFGLSHGMGRSGDIIEPQPKAVGSSVLVKLTTMLMLDVIRRGSGLDGKTAAAHGVVLPLCTGMSMALVLSSLSIQQQQQQQHKHKQQQANDNKTKNSNQKRKKDIVLWSRIDQKSCFKAIQSAGLICVVIPTQIQGDAVVTNLQALQDSLLLYKGRVLAVITTTSCFAPRVPDAVDQVAKLLQTKYNHDKNNDKHDDNNENNENDDDWNVAHIINHAYGLQCATTNQLLNRACTIGRVDAIVCSTDKNFLVPVGGAIVLSPHSTMIECVGKVYAGRASSSPIVDLFVTLLSMGLIGYKQLLRQRQELIQYFSNQFHQVAQKHGERLLHCPTNTISFAITLDGLLHDGDDNNNNNNIMVVQQAEKVQENKTRTATTPYCNTTNQDKQVENDETETRSKNVPSISQTTTVADSTTTTTRISSATTRQEEEGEEVVVVDEARMLSSLGAMLFSRCVSGTRVVPKNITKCLSKDYEPFIGFGSSTNEYPYSYMTAACAIGMNQMEMKEFWKRLDKCLMEFKSKNKKQKNKTKNKKVGYANKNK